MTGPASTSPSRRAAEGLAAARGASAGAAGIGAARSGKASPATHASGCTEDPSTYWEMLRPKQPTGKATVLMVPGGAHTASCYLATADGRPGWAHDFVRAGHPVLLVDWPGTGRSGYQAPDALTGEVVCAGIAQAIAAVGEPVVLLVHSMSGPYGWKVLERVGDRIARPIAIAPGQPGNIQARPDIVRETADEIEIRGTTNYVLDRRTPFVSTPAFVRGKLIGRSRRFPRDQEARYAASLIAIPPRLLQQRLNVGGSQLRVDDFSLYRAKPVLVVTGTDDVDHPRDLEAGVVEWLTRAGAAGEHVYLADRGISGNGHMMMLETSSRSIAKLLLDWIA